MRIFNMWPNWPPEQLVLGPRRSSVGSGGPDLVPTAADWSHWVGIMVNTHFGLETNLFWAPMGPKRVCFGPNFPFLGFSLWDVRCAFLVILGPYDTWYGPKRLFGPNSEASMAPFLLDIFCSKYMLVGCWTGYHTLSTDIGPLLRCERTTRNHVFVGVFRYDSGTPKHALELKRVWHGFCPKGLNSMVQEVKGGGSLDLLVVKGY